MGVFMKKLLLLTIIIFFSMNTFAQASEVTWSYLERDGWYDSMWQYLYVPHNGSVNPDDYVTMTNYFSDRPSGGWQVNNNSSSPDYWCSFFYGTVLQVEAQHPSINFDSILGFVVQQTGYYDIDVATQNPGGSNGQILFLQIDSQANQEYTNGFLDYNVYNPNGGSQHFVHNDIYLEVGDRVLLRLNANGANETSDTTYINNFSLTTAVIPEPLSISLLLSAIVSVLAYRRKQS